MILLIDKRYGGLYLGKGPESITEKEYLEAYKLGKIVIPCINENAEQERKSLFAAIRQLTEKGGSSGEEARKRIRPEYVEDWKVLDFIQEIYNADRDNFAVFFKNQEDLREKLIGRLHGLTRFVCHKIVESQMKNVNSIRTAAGLTISLGDVIDRGYFIEPRYKIASGKVDHTKEASEFCDLTKEDARIMIIGVAGTGKSTLLAKSFLTHANVCVNDRSQRIPFYLSLRGLGANYHFDFDRFLGECCEHDLSKSMYPLFDKKGIEPVFYIDGFDEIAEQFSDIDLKKVEKSVFFSSPLMLCSRTRFAEERLESLGFASRFQTILELLLWEKERSWRYIEMFCKIHAAPELFSKMRDAYFRSEEIAQILENPLLLTMFLWIVHESNMGLPLDVKDQASLYDRFIELWIKREISRTGRNGLSKTSEHVEAIKKAWQLTAWEIYRRRFLNEVIHRDQLAASLVKLDRSFEEVLKDPCYYQFLDIRPHTYEILGMFHEQFLEHVLAKEIVSCCELAKYPFPDFLKYEIRPEINRIIRSLWLRYNEKEMEIMLNNLWTIYEGFLGRSDAISIAVRNHAMYYLGRLPHPEAKKKLNEADKLETDLFVKLSIAFGLMKLGDYDKEKDLFAKLNSEEQWDKANRGYHLVYYGDWTLKGEGPPYLDDGTKSWGNTLRALLRHIADQNDRHIALRRIEVFTIKRLLEVRGSRGPLTVEHLESIKKSIEQTPDNQSGFKGEVEKAYRELEEAFANSRL